MKKQPDGSWTLTKALSPGRYQYKFVVDGSNWKEDPNAKETTDDGYGGKNAVMVVGGGTAAAAPAAGAAAAGAKPLAPGVKPRAPQATRDGVTFTYAGSARSTVALCGDFNSWATTTDAMQQQADGSWTLTRKLPAGTYSYKFLVDGTTWKQDEGNPDSRDDGFGGKNSVVTVK
jgi:1,4-alpha-glucan branching enzyme